MYCVLAGELPHDHGVAFPEVLHQRGQATADEIVRLELLRPREDPWVLDRPRIEPAGYRPANWPHECRNGGRTNLLRHRRGRQSHSPYRCRTI